MDMDKLSVFKALTAKMAWLNQRQRVLAQNVANADTPGYAARDLKAPDFGQVMRDLARRPGGVGGVSLRRTDDGHLSGGGGSDALAGAGRKLDVASNEGVEATPTGNAVVLEEEMMKVSETAADYELMANLYRRNLGLLRLAIGKPGQRG